MSVIGIEICRHHQTVATKQRYRFMSSKEQLAGSKEKYRRQPGKSSIWIPRTESA